MIVVTTRSSSPQLLQGSAASIPQVQRRHDERPPPLRKLSHECGIGGFPKNLVNIVTCVSGSLRYHQYNSYFSVSKKQQQQQLCHQNETKVIRSHTTWTRSFMNTGTVRRPHVSLVVLAIIMMILHLNMSSYCYYINAAASSSFESSSLTTTFLRSVRHKSSKPKYEEVTPRDLQEQPERRSLLVIRILDTPEDSNTTLDRHATLRAVLFDGGDDAATMPSVQKQMNLCSGNAILLVPQFIPDTTDNNSEETFIVDILVSPNLISDQANRNEWVEVMASIACDPDTGPLRNLIGSSSSSNGNVFILEPDDDYYFTSVLRQVADHVVVVLPSIYPDTDFLATAEINNRISMYSVPWATSLSTYMHELAHNLGLRHSGDTINSDIDFDTEYGDSSGYMGESMITPWTPQKCYNAAQHWQLGWFGSNDNGQDASFRLSLSDDATEAPSLPLRINVAAFVDYMTLVSSINTGTYDESFVVLVQVTSNIYLQYNGAKAYNVGTDSVYANEIVVIEQDSDDQSTRVLASLLSGESYVTLDTNRVIHVCDIIANSDVDTSSDVIDYAIIAISDSHTTSSIASVCQNGPEYVTIPSASSPTTSVPTEPPTANTVVVVPTTAPVSTDVTAAPSTNGAVEETPPPTVTPTIHVSNDSNGDTDDSVDPVPQPTNAPIINDTPDDDEEEADDRKTPTLMPSQNLILRGSDNTENSPPGSNTTAVTNESSSENGLATSSIIYSVFGTLLGAIVISIVVLFFLSRHSKPTTYERQSATSRRHAPTRSKSTSSRSKNQQQQFVVANNSSRTMKSPDGSPISRRSSREHNAKYDVEDRSKSTDPSATTRSSSQQKPKLVLERQRKPAVTTTCFYKSKSNKNQMNDIENHDDDDSSDDDDKSDTLSVILQQEIQKDRVNRILQSVLFVQDKDGTVTQMMPATAAVTTNTDGTKTRKTGTPPNAGKK